MHKMNIDAVYCCGDISEQLVEDVPFESCLRACLCPHRVTCLSTCCSRDILTLTEHSGVTPSSLFSNSCII